MFTIGHDIYTLIFIVYFLGGIMAKPIKIKNKNGSTSYRIFIKKKIDGKLIIENKTFSTGTIAQQWHDKRIKDLEYESIHGKPSTEKISEIILRYQDQFSQSYGRSKNYDIARLLKYPIADISCSKLSAKHIIAHCIERNKNAKPQTVLNDVIWLRTILRTMSATEGFEYHSDVFERAMVVLKQEKLVAKSAIRERLPKWKELLKLSRHFKKSRSKIPMLDVMWFAYFSSRRLSEITRLEWVDNNDDRKTGMVRDAKHPREKKGNHQRFKYEKSSWRIVQRQSRNSDYIFPYNSKTVGTLFDRACKLNGIIDLHFHDLRHAAATRLLRMGYTIDETCLFTLHSDWKTLQRYVNRKPEDID